MSIKQAIESLEEAIEAVRFFHGPIAWEAYRDHSPEMKRWSAALAALRSMPQGEPVAWQFRWTNPGDNINAHPDELAWKALEPRGSETMAERMAEIAHYTYDGKPCYEVRALGVLATPPTEAVRMSEAERDVLAERKRQVNVEGYNAAEDDEYGEGTLAQAAACYATAVESTPAPMDWPWPLATWKPKTFRSNLVRAGALIIAEIERLDRAVEQATAARLGVTLANKP